jgi:ubiquinone/menaquinone biosynthesis C-methylase UbiE
MAQQGFQRGAELYQHSRPDYPEEIIGWLQHQLQLQSHSRIVDLGAGTGKFLPYLKRISTHICAIEPISEMLAQLKQVHPEVTTIQTDSQHLGLALHSIDAVCCAQSFHWFAQAESLQEIYQILKPHGALGLIWNQRDTRMEWVQAIADLLAPLEQDTPRFHSWHWQEVFKQCAFFDLQSLQHFYFQHVGTVEQVVVNRILSTSFISAATLSEKQNIRKQLLDIMRFYCDKTAQDQIAFPYITYAYHYKKC